MTFLPEVMRIDPVDLRIAYGLALIAVVMLLPGGVIAGSRTRLSVQAQALRGAPANSGSADAGAPSWT